MPLSVNGGIALYDICIYKVDIKMSKRGYKCKPMKSKTVKWVKTIDAALAEHRLMPGDASKLAGRLSWASSHMFRWVLMCSTVVCPLFCMYASTRKLGRAMLRPIYDQQTRRDGMTSPELKRSLQWWRDVLQRGLSERRAWKHENEPAVNLFCDASGYPAYLGAVLFIDGRCYYTDFAPTSELLAMFKSRNDNQIMGLELLSISLGLCTFERLIRGRNVIVHSDNTGSEAAIRRGTAVSMDHAQLVHKQWTHIAEQGLRIHVVRVGTHDNIADLPSRRVRLSLSGVDVVSFLVQNVGVRNVGLSRS